MPKAHSDMTGKVCIVTGSNSGVGKETSRKLITAGADLIMLCRNPVKAEAAREELLNSVPGASISLYIADISVIEDVKRVAAEILENHPQIHLLVNNAGGHLMDREYTVDGHEVNMAVNFMGPFLLTNLLLDRLKVSAPSRIVNVASEAHRIGSFMPFEDFQNERSMVAIAYMRAKFYMMLFTQSLTRKLDGSGVSVNSVCPGLVASNFFPVQPMKTILEWLAATGIFTINTPEKGSRSSNKAATDPAYADKSGDFIASHPVTKLFKPMKKVYDHDLQDALWKFAAEATGIE